MRAAALKGPPHSIDQSFPQPALAAELPLDTLHAPVVTFVIVPQEVQEAM